MKGLEKKRRTLLTVIIAEGVLAILAVIGAAVCCVQLSLISTRHNADILDLREEYEIFDEKVAELEVSNKLAQIGFEKQEEQISADVKVENVGDNSSMITTVEKQGIKEALSDPYLFIKTQDEVEISVQTDFMKEVIITVYFLKGPKDLNDSYNYDSIKEALKHPIVRNTLKDGNFKKRLNETGIYLVELSGQNTEELYFAINLK